ncbi:MAG TPA: DUF3300 domain-containing protein [Silvibacterium sp.]|nr:DUF3300 domain-containing protein [Silvibacterium sp.]
MNPLKHPRDFFSPKLQGVTLNIGRKALACCLAYLMVPLGIGDLYAQSAPPPPDQQQYQPPPDPNQDQQYQDQAPPPPDQQQDQDDQDQDQGPPPEAYNPLAPEQLDQMVAPIALYPDALVAQILAASTYPTQVADADHFLQSNQGAPPDQLANMANGMNWDPSVKALIAFPSVLANLDRNFDWTTQLGNAYYNQPQDVMAAVQDMRQRAYASGNLRSTSQIAVDYQPGDIIIAPANPNVVYVPWYDPWTIYGEPIAPWGGYYVRPRPAGLVFAAGIGLGFGIGIGIASWNHYGWGWHNWGVGWHDRTVVYQRNVYISNSDHVKNHGYYGHFDRNPQARIANRNIARRAPNYRPANMRGPANNRPNNNVRTNNNFNRPNNNQRPANNYNRPNNNARPAYNNGRPENNRPNNNSRPAYTNNREPAANNRQPATNNYNRPSNNSRPAYTNNREPAANNREPATNNYNRPNNNARPAYNNNRPPAENNRPAARPENNPRPAQNYNRPQPQSRPQPQARPQARQQSRPESRPANKSNDKDKEKPH